MHTVFSRIPPARRGRGAASAVAAALSLNDPSTCTLSWGPRTLSSENVHHDNSRMTGALIVTIPVIPLRRHSVTGLVGR